MKIALVGAAARRARLRTALEAAGLEISGEGDSPSDVSTLEPRPDLVVIDTDLIAPLHDDLIPDEPLTPREREVLEWLAEGLSNRAIAERLGISEHTVKFHIASVYGKLGVSTRAEAVRRGLRRGLISI